ncbi:hypothetical protein RRF57_008576 [Xylaria bambusicola]|uniref:Uncharacterized protein n=1 Tax=Xylaria bambusicola TaxID=326684 RepID=A0AAN7UPM7_9PEZI
MSHWIQFRLLQDFMEIGADLQRCPDMLGKNHQPGDRARSIRTDEPQGSGPATPDSRAERPRRTKVQVLDYFQNHDVKIKPHNVDSAENLQKALGEHGTGIADNHRFHLYVAEDLSRDVIEVLGSGLNIEANVF